MIMPPSLRRAAWIVAAIFTAAPVNADDAALGTRPANPAMPSREYRECLFRNSGIKPDGKFDELDRDMLYMRAGTQTIEEFLDGATLTDPPKSYRQLLSIDQAKSLLRQVKSRARCD
jgi:hypothetical protein